MIGVSCILELQHHQTESPKVRNHVWFRTGPNSKSTNQERPQNISILCKHIIPDTHSHTLPDDGRSISRNVAEKHYDSRHDKLRSLLILAQLGVQNCKMQRTVMPDHCLLTKIGMNCWMVPILLIPIAVQFWKTVSMCLSPL